jgi:hypothetical protein
MTLAVTLVPQSRLNGEARKIEIGTVQDFASLILCTVPLQFFSSVEKVKSSYWIKMIYDVIGAPLSTGAFQLITTESSTNVVSGA